MYRCGDDSGKVGGIQPEALAGGTRTLKVDREKLGHMVKVDIHQKVIHVLFGTNRVARVFLGIVESVRAFEGNFLQKRILTLLGRLASALQDPRAKYQARVSCFNSEVLYTSLSCNYGPKVSTIKARLSSRGAGSLICRPLYFTNLMKESPSYFAVRKVRRTLLVCPG